MSSPSPAAEAVRHLGPAVTAATAFALADVLGKIVFADGGSVLTMVTLRGVIGLALMYVWLGHVGWPAAVSVREKTIALGAGLLFAGITYGLYKAIDAMDVPTAVLAYFSYPLLTGLAAAATGIEKLSWRGAVAALVAFFGLALTIGAHPVGLSLAGLGFAFFAALCRTANLLVTRTMLARTDPRLSTWYSMVSSVVIFVGASAVLGHWQPPHSAAGWTSVVSIGLVTVVAVLALFKSTGLIGPFRTALIMNVEPLLATVLSAIFLGEILSPLQALGAAIMLGALVAFQMRR